MLSVHGSVFIVIWVVRMVSPVARPTAAAMSSGAYRNHSDSMAECGVLISAGRATALPAVPVFPAEGGGQSAREQRRLVPRLFQGVSRRMMAQVAGHIHIGSAGPHLVEQRVP